MTLHLSPYDQSFYSKGKSEFGYQYTHRTPVTPEQMSKPMVFFDMDDTLMDCGVYYDMAKKEFGEYIANIYSSRGFSASDATGILNAIDLAATTVNGFGRTRFPNSFEAALWGCARLVGFQSKKDFVTHIPVVRYIAESVFRQQYTIYPEAVRVLQTLRQKGYRLGIITKGDREVQMKKIADNGIGELVDEVYVSTVKTVDWFKNVKSRTHAAYHGNVGKAYPAYIMIGDSMRDDIIESKKAGFEAIWFDNPQKPSWGYENTTDGPTHVIDRLDQAIDQIFDIEVELGLIPESEYLATLDPTAVYMFKGKSPLTTFDGKR